MAHSEASTEETVGKVCGSASSSGFGFTGFAIIAANTRTETNEQTTATEVADGQGSGMVPAEGGELKGEAEKLAADRQEQPRRELNDDRGGKR